MLFKSDRIKRFVQAYQAALNERELSPTGDDFNLLCDGIEIILAGGHVDAALDWLDRAKGIHR